MKKNLLVFLILVISQYVTLNAFAGSDGSFELKSKKQSSDVKDCFETINRGIFAFNQGLDKVFFKQIRNQ